MIVLCNLDKMLLSTFEKSYNKLSKSETLPSIHFNNKSLYIVLPRCTHSLTYSIELPSFIEMQLLRFVATYNFFENT